jgi:hypothetical protein
MQGQSGIAERRQLASGNVQIRSFTVYMLAVLRNAFAPFP